MNRKPTTFLVVEDNELDLEKILRGFNGLKISNDVISANDGYEALDILRGTGGKEKLHPPYVVLLDLNMPRMNGLEFLKELRADPNLSPTPVFVLSTSEMQSDVDAAYEYNVCGYVVKPLVLDQMMTALATLNMYWTLSELPQQAKAV